MTDNKSLEVPLEDAIDTSAQVTSVFGSEPIEPRYAATRIGAVEFVGPLGESRCVIAEIVYQIGDDECTASLVKEHELIQKQPHLIDVEFVNLVLPW